ncbi:ABC transporter permease [Methanomassiliicoccales archaeon LGM-DZ1]|nr:ABC transporter permease [Methanomassiliicoccales archaeon LGM-DZ1]
MKSGGNKVIRGARHHLRELYASRSILHSLVYNNLFGRYRNSALGFAWNFIIPMVMICVYYVVFTEIRKSAISDFMVYVLSAMFPFSFMTQNLTGGASAITGNSGMVKKIYFPREILVFAQTLSTFLIMLIGYSVSLILIAATGFSLDWVSMLFVPAVLILELIFVTGYVFLFSSLTVYSRDVQYVLNSISMVFFFMTPMYFFADEATGLLNALIWINPFTYFVEALHSAVYFGEPPDAWVISMCLLLALFALVLGYAVFRRLKRGFAERL